MTIPEDHMTQWREDCMREHGRVLEGKKAHYCFDWDFLPVDETVFESDFCTCFNPPFSI